MIAIPISKKIRYLFSTGYSVIGVISLMGCLIFSYVTFSAVDWDVWNIPEDAPFVWGKVKESKSLGNGTYKVYYTYRVDGKTYNKDIYVDKTSPVKNESVEVYYDELNPEIATIWGAEDEINGTGLTIIFFLGFLSPVAFLIGTVKQREQLNILNNGAVSYGKLVRKRRVKDEFESKKIYSLTFRYQLENGKFIRSQVETFRLKQTTDEEQELIVYHTKKPQRFALVDDFPDYLIGEVRNAALSLDG